jgi:hypothetical protein
VTTFDSEDIQGDILIAPKPEKIMDEYEMKRTGMTDSESESQPPKGQIQNKLVKESSNDEGIWYEESSATEFYDQ